MRSDTRVFVAAMAGVVAGVLVVAMLPAVAAVVGDPLGLGEVNSIDERTDLKGAAKGANLQIKNTGNARALSAKADKIPLLAKATSGPVAISAKASRNAIKIKVGDGQAPIKVNAIAGTATNLSADLLDGLDSTAFLQPSGLRAAHSGGGQAEAVTSAEVVRSVSLTVPAEGVVIVNSTATALDGDVGDTMNCSITTGTDLDHEFNQLWQSGGAGGGASAQLAGTRGFDVGPTRNFTVNLVCDALGDGFILDSSLTAIFIPNP
jgi:hypothetical protein